MNTYEGAKTNPKCILMGFDDPLFDPVDTSTYFTDSSPLPEPTVVTVEGEGKMVCDCCGCQTENVSH